MFTLRRKVSRALIYNPVQKKVLVIKSYFSLGYTLPGGGVKSGETYEQSAVREIGEELGITVDAIKKVALFKKLHADRRLFLPLASDIHVFAITLSREVSIKANHEIRHWFWATEEESETLLKRYYNNPF